MSAAPAATFITINDFLAQEEVSLEKHEYYKGEVFLMAGASVAHNTIVGNSLIEIGSFFRDKPGRIFPSDLRIHIEANSLFTYPDLSIFYDELDMYRKRTDTVLNPVVIIEVLSKSTEDYDRGTKFTLYRQIPALKEYILISSTKALVEKYVKQSDYKWVLTIYDKPENALTIEAIDYSIEIRDLYRNVSFEEETE